MPIAKSLRMTNPVEVRSSSLARLSYDRQQAILHVEFRDGTAYQYAGVPLGTYQSLLQADSKGVSLPKTASGSSIDFQIIVVVVLYWRRVNNDSGLARVEVSNPPNR